MDAGIMLYAARENKLSLNALAGALEAHPDLRGADIAFPKDEAGLLDCAGAMLARHDTAAAAFSFFSSQVSAAGAAAARLRAFAGKRVFLVAGGPHPSGDPAHALSLGFDAVVIGEGERALPELALCAARGADWRGVKGIAYAGEGGACRFSGAGGRVRLDDYPPGSLKYGRFGAVEITRGCPYGCKFCQTTALMGAAVRHRSVEAICGYSASLCARGMRDFRAVTPNAFAYGSPDGKTLNLPELSRLLKSLRKTVGISGKVFLGSFPSEVRPEHVTRETAALIKQYADNDNLVIGAQSASPAVLARCGRGHDAEAAPRAVDITLAAGLKANVDFIFCLPGETEADAALSARCIRRLASAGARIHAHTFMPLPGTPFRNERKAGTLEFYKSELRDLFSSGGIYGDWLEQDKIGS